MIRKELRTSWDRFSLKTTENLRTIQAAQKKPWSYKKLVSNLFKDEREQPDIDIDCTESRIIICLKWGPHRRVWNQNKLDYKTVRNTELQYDGECWNGHEDKWGLETDAGSKSCRLCDNTVSSFTNGLSHIQKGCTVQIDLHLKKIMNIKFFPLWVFL